MHSWFTQKVNELIGLAHYCQFPIIKAHFILAQKAIDEMYGEERGSEQCLREILPLLMNQADQDGHSEAARHLEKALQTLDDAESDIERNAADTKNVLKLDFAGPRIAKAKQQG